MADRDHVHRVSRIIDGVHDATTRSVLYIFRRLRSELTRLSKSSRDSLERFPNAARSSASSPNARRTRSFTISETDREVTADFIRRAVCRSGSKYTVARLDCS